MTRITGKNCLTLSVDIKKCQTKIKQTKSPAKTLQMKPQIKRLQSNINEHLWFLFITPYPIYRALSYLSRVLLESISLSFGKNENVLDQPWLVSNGLPGWRMTYMPRTIKVRGFTSAPSVLNGKESLCK